jgi:hypothetical protein
MSGDHEKQNYLSISLHFDDITNGKGRKRNVVSSVFVLFLSGSECFDYKENNLKLGRCIYQVGPIVIEDISV